ncbi:unnamed protein product [Nippostrongylus brasiliensis]|uniref:Protein YIPF n=1 Tax=Nippostrongylus brasiliensis TaxID=27835 RepID=A0A0N4XZP3_NIPBR|nr:unnamed protein product [Nippostrongylus brasiliensis]
MANLEFHPFQDGFSINSTNTQGFSGSIGDQNRLVNEGDGVSSSGRTSNLFSMSFYRQFFDVETDQVLKRVLNSVVPTNSNFILDYVHPMPDLWGPFWISVTLVFSIGVFGNIAQYIENDGLPGEYGSDFRLVTTSATLVFLYVVLVPVILSTILWQRKSELQFALTDLLCAYGYSLSIFIPVSVYFFDAVHPHVDKPAPQPNQTGPDPNAVRNSNSQVLTNERVQKILSSSLPSVTKDSTKSKENKEDSAKSNESKQKTSKEEKAVTASHLGSTVAPAASTNSSAG